MLLRRDPIVRQDIEGAPDEPGDDAPDAARATEPTGKPMGQRQKKGRPVSGWLILDKPLGMTSTQAVAVVKRLFGKRRRPAMPGRSIRWRQACCRSHSGEATKTVPYVMDGRKIYGFTVRFRRGDDDGRRRGRRRRPLGCPPVARGHRGCAAPPSPARSCRRRRPSRRSRSMASAPMTSPATARRSFSSRGRSRCTALDLVEMADADHAVLAAECGKGTDVRALARISAARSAAAAMSRGSAGRWSARSTRRRW